MIGHRTINKYFNSSFVYLLVVITLVLWGLVVMYSASYHEAFIHGLPHYYFLKNQFNFFVLALFAAVVIKLMDFKYIEFFIYPLMVISVICMLLTLFSPFGVSIMGAKRWLKLGPAPSFQPSELVKVSTILFIAKYYSKENKKDLVAFLVVLFNAALILLQKDYSTTMLYLASNFLFLLVCGCDFKKVFLIGMFLIIPAAYAILVEPFRIKRIVSFLNPSLDPTGINYQINNSLAAIQRGGLFGVGLGNGIYKLGRLPEVQNDFIFSSLSEETGFVGIILTLLLFYLILKIGFAAASKMSADNNLVKSYVCFGISVSISLQLIINVMVVTALIPPTGIPLPFISQGGTNLFFSIIEVSLIYKIIRENEQKDLEYEENYCDYGEKDDVEYKSKSISSINIGSDFTNYMDIGTGR
jgi:cell division protein FtsW